MKDWCLSFHKDQYLVVLYKVPWYIRALENGWERLCTITRGWVAGHGMPRVFWNIPVGWPSYDTDDDGRYLTNSIAWELFRLETKILLMPIKYRVIEIDISRDDAYTLSPGFVQLIEETDAYDGD